MRDYQPKQVSLPGTVWRQCIFLVRDYERLREEYEAAIQQGTPPPDGQPRAKAIKNQTEREGIVRAQMSIRLRAIENALYTVPEEYREGVWNNVVRGWRYPGDAHVQTYKRYKTRFITEVARNLFLI